MAEPKNADVVIIGGGVMGSAVAYYLGELGFHGRRVVIERDTSYRLCSTARSAGGLRQQFSTPENIAMSQATLAVIRELKARFGSDADVGFREQGYLILASAEGKQTLAANVAIQRAANADIELLDPARLASAFPWLAIEDLAAGSFGRSGEGWLDPVSLMTLYQKAAAAAGTQWIKEEVVGIEMRGGRIAGVRLSNGAAIACGTLVIAAGPGSGAVAAMAGIALPVEPRKRYVYVLDCRDATEALRRAPLTVDPSGVWFRPEGQTFICGKSPEADEEPPPGDLDVIDHAFFEDQVWPVLATRVPQFEAVKMISAWAGHYDYNVLDQNAVIGPHPEIGNLLFTTGFSGHGLQQSAAAGRAIAELLVTGGYRAIDLTRFGYERIARREPLLELNVI